MVTAMADSFSCRNKKEEMVLNECETSDLGASQMFFWSARGCFGLSIPFSYQGAADLGHVQVLILEQNLQIAGQAVEAVLLALLLEVLLHLLRPLGCAGTGPSRSLTRRLWSLLLLFLLTAGCDLGERGGMDE